MSFSNLKKHVAQKDAVRVYEFEEICLDKGGKLPVKFHVKHAGQSNDAWMNVHLEHTAKLAAEMADKRGVKKADVARESLKNSHERDLEIYPTAVIVGWENVYDSNFKSVDFSVDACRDFLQALGPDWFMLLRDYCTNFQNFTDSTSHLSPQEAKEAVKNS